MAFESRARASCPPPPPRILRVSNENASSLLQDAGRLRDGGEDVVVVAEALCDEEGVEHDVPGEEGGAEVRVQAAGGEAADVRDEGPHDQDHEGRREPRTHEGKIDLGLAAAIPTHANVPRTPSRERERERSRERERAPENESRV